MYHDVAQCLYLVCELHVLLVGLTEHLHMLIPWKPIRVTEGEGRTSRLVLPLHPLLVWWAVRCHTMWLHPPHNFPPQNYRIQAGKTTGFI